MTDTIVMIHGMWGGDWCWENYRAFFEERGYRCYTPVLRHHDVSPQDRPAPALGQVSLLDYVDDLEGYIRDLKKEPILMGHSMGGLLAQMLCARGLGKGAVLLTPAPPAGINALTFSVIRSFGSILSKWGFWRTPHRIPFKSASYAMMHRLSPEQRQREYAKLVFESGRAAAEIGFWLLDPRRAARVDASAVTCPMLVVAGKEDRITPASVTRKIARKYGHVSTYRELDGHAHWVIGEDGWEKIAEAVLGWMAGTLK